MPRKIVSNAQQECRDRFAPAPKIDLTLRTNGEESVSVIDALGNVIPAGFDAPTVAPTVVDGTAAGVDWTAGSTFTGVTVYWQYRYVYAAKTRYPRVENAVTANGSQAPRSNPSPQLLTTEDNSGGGLNKTRVLSLAPSSRDDISHIWIYRTGAWDTKDKADTAGNAGVMFWIGEVENNPNLSTVPFEDKGMVLSPGQEQIENDNFPAPEAKYCRFDGTFFWTIGNDVRIDEVTVNATGFVTRINDSIRPWFNGRNGQIATFDGITSGGFDNHGSFYIKILNTRTAQLYSDLALTQIAGTSITGTSQIHLRGLSTTLFRSKIRNPFAWGYTDLVGNLQVPTPYNFSLGGGRATSLEIVPNLNLLKIDVENPTQTYTLNLKNAGTPNFEPSLRPIADAYTSSVNGAQFSATVERGRNQLWALDTKAFAIVASDGTSQVPVSDFVCETMRQLSVDGSDRELFHGCFMPRLDLNLMFVRTDGAVGLINRAIYNHWPTGQWGILDTFDVSASCPMVNPFTNETEVLVGNSNGWIGIFGHPDQFTNWCDGTRKGTLRPHPTDATKVLASGGNIQSTTTGVINNWMLMWDETADGTKALNFRYVKVLAVGGTVIQGFIAYRELTLDTSMYDRNFVPCNSFYPASFPAGLTHRFAIGAIEMQVGRFFNGEVPFAAKSIEDVYFTLSYADQTGFQKPSVVFGSNYRFDFENIGQLVDVAENLMNVKTLETPHQPNYPIIYGKQTSLPIDQTAVFGIMVSDRNTVSTVLYNYQINLSPT